MDEYLTTLRARLDVLGQLHPAEGVWLVETHHRAIDYPDDGDPWTTYLSAGDYYAGVDYDAVTITSTTGEYVHTRPLPASVGRMIKAYDRRYGPDAVAGM